MKQSLAGFRDFVMRGNVLDLAVAVILGAAFGAVVQAFTDGILMALIAAIVGEPSFDAITISVGDGELLIGSFLTALVNFLIIAGALYVIIQTYENLQGRRRGDDAPEEASTASDEAVLLAEIRDLLRAQTS